MQVRGFRGCAAGPCVPAAFTNTTCGRGITWGVCHNTLAGERDKTHSVLMRFDCDLSLDVHDPEMKRHCYYYKPEFYYQHGLSRAEYERALEQARRVRQGKAAAGE